MTDEQPDASLQALAQIRAEIAKTSVSTRRRAMEKFALAALGSIPWVGGFISAAASLRTDERSIKKDSLQTQWLEEHTKKMERLGIALDGVARRFESLGDQIDERIQSEDYLALVRQAFATWDNAATEEKRSYIGNLVANAAGTRLCSDDVVRLFIGSIDIMKLISPSFVKYFKIQASPAMRYGWQFMENWFVKIPQKQTYLN
jgi:hypothetical protein